jgi:hypothetical protein
MYTYAAAAGAWLSLATAAKPARSLRTVAMTSAYLCIYIVMRYEWGGRLNPYKREEHMYSQIIAPNIATDSILATSQIDPILAVYREGEREGGREGGLAK